MRVKPRRETRGVSRSKCGDLITACVPVSWATSIIVSESTDAIDYFDGFGTTELVVGIRAYQWGWEYYYPKDLDLHYDLKKNYSSFVGNSLKYEKSTDLKSSSIDLWKLYQNKTSDAIITPAHLLVVPYENKKLFNLFNGNDVGLNSLNESNSFKRIKMFSKFYTSNLYFSNSKFLNKYKKINSYITSDDNFYNSTVFNVKRQHNFLSAKTLITKNLTNFDISSLKKLVNYNLKTNLLADKNRNLYLKNFTNSNSLNQKNVDNVSEYVAFSKTKFFNFDAKKNKTFSYPELMRKLNNNSDKKKIANPSLALLNKKAKKSLSFDFETINKIRLNDETLLFLHLNENDQEFFNKTIDLKKFDMASSNQSVLLPNRNIRNFSDIKPNQPSLNFLNSVNQTNSLLINNLSSSHVSSSDLFKNLFTKNVDNKTFLKLFQSRISIDSPLSPIASSNVTISSKNYDNLKFVYAEETPIVLQGKEEVTPTSLTSIYWNFFWSNSDFDWRLSNLNNLKKKHNAFYLPIFSFYYDYDFRNWQALELLEDSYWETTFSSYSWDEANSLKEFYKSISLNEDSLDFHLNKNILGKYESNSSYASLYSDDFFTNVNSLLTKNFYIFGNLFLYTQSEENFDSQKSLFFFFNQKNLSTLLINRFNFTNPTYSTILDSFRSDYDEFSFVFDEKNLNNLTYLTNIESNGKQPYLLSEIQDDAFNGSNHFRTSNGINLRGTARNSIVSYNAIQKVFRTRLDENRSNAKMNDFNNSFLKQQFVVASRTSYENLLGKNKISYFETNSFKEILKKNINSFYFNNSVLNFQFFDFPFLIALKSDASRYMWFDWFAKWGFFEVQPSSSSRYAIYGMPYFNKTFEYSSLNNENLNETETYFLRLSRSRKNFLPNWIYTPYFFAKNKEWKKNNIFFLNQINFKNSIINSKVLLNNSSFYWQKLNFSDSSIKTYFPSNSGLSTYNKTNWKPLNSTQSYYWHSSALIDILSKREFVYREFFLKTKKIIALPKIFLANPTHPLLLEIKNSFDFFDKLYLNSEYSRESYLFSLNFFNYTYFKIVYADFLKYLNMTKTFDSFLFYFFDSASSKEKLFNRYETNLFKNQYRPLKKGISNMVRLHATGAVAMPIEIRIQVLASSKDVIHSWAIPSAGIKIDCVPGYSSHRVMIFLVSGIFWGQCMEICGRYHHWMPIIVYFMKRDLFFLWCTHFIFYNPYSNTVQSNDRQNLNFLKPVYFSKDSWTFEI